MKAEVLNKLTEKICNRMCLDYSYYLAFKSNPERALDDLYDDKETKAIITKEVNKRVGTRINDWWAERSGCCCSAVVYEID
jgi:hypothetical protein